MRILLVELELEEMLRRLLGGGLIGEYFDEGESIN